MLMLMAWTACSLHRQPAVASVHSASHHSTTSTAMVTLVHGEHRGGPSMRITINRHAVTRAMAIRRRVVPVKSRPSNRACRVYQSVVQANYLDRISIHSKLWHSKSVSLNRKNRERLLGQAWQANQRSQYRHFHLPKE